MNEDIGRLVAALNADTKRHLAYVEQINELNSETKRLLRIASGLIGSSVVLTVLAVWAALH